MRIALLSLMIGGILIISTGCESKGKNSEELLTPVSGKVTLADGKPAAFVEVWFFPKEAKCAQGFAKTNDKGEFPSVESLGKQGLVPGKYAVAVRPMTGKQGTPSASIPKKIQENDNTDLLIDVMMGQPLTISIPKP